MEKIRIQKIIADAGYCSRRKAEQLIEAGRVKINGRPCKLGDKALLKDKISVDGEPITAPQQNHIYLAMYKPRGYITTSSDEHGRKCVMDLLPDTGGRRVYPVGRLDKDSEGLLLLTSDGEFTNRLTHPRHEISKTYRVTVRPEITDEQAASLASGVTLDDKTVTRPSTIIILTKEPGRAVLKITIKEGKNRQIRRMCEAVGLEVARLRRIQVGPVKLGMLSPGECRPLTKLEVELLK